MIAAEFDYAVAASVDDAIALLGEGGADARPLAGGHSLLPLMKLRFSAPKLLVDLRRCDDLRGVQIGDATHTIGALTRHADLQKQGDNLPLIAAAASKVADQQVRNRGTIGGSLAHGDAAADLPAVVLAMDGSVAVRGASGEREIAAADLWQGYLQTSLQPGEILTHVRVPALAEYGFGYEKFNRRAEDWAMVGVCALVKASDGVCEDVRIGMTHMASVPLRATAAEDALRGQPLDAQHIAAAAALAAEGTDPIGDLNATADYKRHLARVLTRRALTTAAGGG